MSISRTAEVPHKKKKYKLLFMILPFMLIIFLFNYVPLFGWLYSLFDYLPGVSLKDSEFVGLYYFRMIFKDANVLRSLKNTAIFALINVVCTPLPMIFAILLNEIHSNISKRVIQTFTTLPNFISWVIVYSLAFSLFASDGVITVLLSKIIGQEAGSILSSGDAVYWFQTILMIWKGLGWNAIIYLAAITGIDQEQYEAARVDGAGYFQCAIRITVPELMGTYVTLFILQIGNFLNTGYEQYMLFKNPMTAANIEVLDLYTYRIGLENMDYSYGVAVGIVKSIVSITLVFLANMLSKKVRGNSVV